MVELLSVITLVRKYSVRQSFLGAKARGSQLNGKAGLNQGSGLLCVGAGRAIAEDCGDDDTDMEGRSTFFRSSSFALGRGQTEESSFREYHPPVCS